MSTQQCPVLRCSNCCSKVRWGLRFSHGVEPRFRCEQPRAGPTPSSAYTALCTHLWSSATFRGFVKVTPLSFSFSLSQHPGGVQKRWVLTEIFVWVCFLPTRSFADQLKLFLFDSFSVYPLASKLMVLKWLALLQDHVGLSPGLAFHTSWFCFCDLGVGHPSPPCPPILSYRRQ